MLHIANFGGLIKIYGKVDRVSAQAKLHRLAENSTAVEVDHFWNYFEFIAE